MPKAKSAAKAKHCNVIDMTKAPYTAYGVGRKRSNPRLCFSCGQPIRKGEAWRADTSAEDTEGNGRYTVIQHSPTCPDQRVRDQFQKLLASRKSN